MSGILDLDELLTRRWVEQGPWRGGVAEPRDTGLRWTWTTPASTCSPLGRGGARARPRQTTLTFSFEEVALPA